MNGTPESTPTLSLLVLSLPLESLASLSLLTLNWSPFKKLLNNSPAGQLPRSVECLLLSDLADSAPVGSRLLVAGVFRLLSGSSFAPSSSSFATVLIGVSVQVLNEDSRRPAYSVADFAMIKELSFKPNLFELLSSSIAPSIFGHNAVKKGILLMLAGGVEHVIGNHGRIRGDINVLLVGDPATAKSQMLRYTLRTVTIGVSASGRGSSSAGLTAAVVPDTFASSHLSSLGVVNEKRLEAGALVLADRGFCVIDEFDKLDDQDRGVLHEAMEQQTVSIAKAGIQATLNARSSILAAANPLHNLFDSEKSLSENIGIPDSLLSRFDLVFVIRGAGDTESDSKIASHVLRIHQESAQNRDQDDCAVAKLLNVSISDKVDDESVDLNALEQNLIEGQNVDVESDDYFIKDSYGTESLKQDFLKKYLYYIKTRFSPRLTPEASQAAVDYYCQLREKYEGLSKEQGIQFSVPITPRALETLFRLSCAHAKIRWSSVVEVEDVEVAIEVAAAALNSPFTNFYSETVSRVIAEARTRTQSNNGEPKRSRTGDDEEVYLDSDVDTPLIEPNSISNDVTDSRYEEFTELMYNSFSVIRARKRRSLMKLEELLGSVNQAAVKPFSSEEFEIVLDRLKDDEILAVQDDSVVFY
ncbi:hypothetical protein GEMRC1_008902 [Eukaryota sp. GEM-RC1]